MPHSWKAPEEGRPFFKISSHNDFHIFICLFFKVWINQGDIILVGLRDYQDAKADVILKYNADEARNLKTYGEIPDSVRLPVTDVAKMIKFKSVPYCSTFTYCLD